MKPFIHFLKSKPFFLFLSLITGAYLLFPIIDYQPLLSPGDHGRDLYAFAQTHQGQIPYIDYWWVYGPLMPYYYSLFIKLLGMTIPSILIGKIVLILTSAAFIYLTLALIISPVMSFIATYSFFIYSHDFFFTYNHLGGITLIVAAIYCCLLTIHRQKDLSLNLGLIAIFLLCLVKINIGISTLFAYVLSIIIARWGQSSSFSFKQLFIKAFIILPAAVGAIYYMLLKNLPLYAIRQCLPYLKSDHPIHTTPVAALNKYMTILFGYVISDWASIIFTIIICLCALQATIYLNKKTELGINRTTLLTTLIALAIFYTFNIHEFVLSGVRYRSYWSEPMSLMFIFIIFYLGIKKIPDKFKFILYIIIFSFLSFQSILRTTSVNKAKDSSRYLTFNTGKVYLGNTHQSFDTFVQTTQYLNRKLSKDETFFALPYIPLYYYLTEKTSPTRQTIFYEHINIPAEQENKIIGELEKNNVNWIVLSNRSESREPGLGTLGETYCPLIGKYIKDNFKVVEQFGDWNIPAGWAWNHSVRVYRRVE